MRGRNRSASCQIRSLGLYGALNLRGSVTVLARSLDDAQEFLHVFPRGFLAGEVRKKAGRCADSSLSSRIWSGMRPASTAAYSENLSHSSEPGFRPSCLAQVRRVSSSRGGWRYLAFYLAPITGVMAVLQTKLTQAEPPARPQFLYERSKHRLSTVSWYKRYHNGEDRSRLFSMQGVIGLQTRSQARPKPNLAGTGQTVDWLIEVHSRQEAAPVLLRPSRLARHTNVGVTIETN